MSEYPDSEKTDGLNSITAAQVAPNDLFVLGDASETPAYKMKGLPKSELVLLNPLPFLRGNIVPPVLANYSWINQGNATVEDSRYGLYMSIPGANGDSLAILKKSITGLSSIVFCFLPFHRSVNYRQTGILVRESSSGKLISWGWLAYNSQLMCTKWNSPTSWNSNINYFSQAGAMFSLLWLKIRWVNSHLYFDWSNDGYHWLELINDAAAGFMIPDEYGIFVNPSYVGEHTAATFFSIEEA